MKVGEIGEEDLHSQAQVDGVRVSTHTSLFSDLLQCKNNRSLSKVARGLLTRHFASIFFFFPPGVEILDVQISASSPKEVLLLVLGMEKSSQMSSVKTLQRVKIIR